MKLTEGAGTRENSQLQICLLLQHHGQRCGFIDTEQS